MSDNKDIREKTTDKAAGGKAGKRGSVRNKVSVSYVLFGEFLSSGVIRRNVGFIVLVVCSSLLLIGNGYASQNEEKEATRLREEVEDAKYRALTLSSELMDRTRQSHIEEHLRQIGDSALKSPTSSPYILTVDTAE